MRSLRSELFGPVMFGLAVVLFLVVGGIGWAMHAPLSGAVIAPGLVSFEGERKTVQHLEGGIIRRIFVGEGDRVAAGDVLLSLEDTTVRSRTDELLSRIRALGGEEARLRAERSRQPAIVFDHPTLQDRQDPKVAAIVAQQESLFAARAHQLRTRMGILLKRIDQSRRKREGTQKQLVGVREQLRLVREEETAVAELYERGYARRPRLLAIRRAEAQFVATEGELLASLARIGEEMNETELQIAGLATDLVGEAEVRLAQLQAERVSAETIYRDMLDRLARTRVIAPVDGVVFDLRFKTIGGVIPPGEPILQIAPAFDRLVINAKIRPTDVDEVAVGSRATVMFPAYAQRRLPRIQGRVLRVAADASKGEDGGESYFAVVVEIDRNDLAEAAPGVRVVAGMPADVYIATAERTVYEFLVGPLEEIFARALRES